MANLNLKKAIERMGDIIKGKIVNPTQVTAHQLGGLTKDEIDDLMYGKVDMAETGLSLYGDNSFLPVNISGSFEGSAPYGVTGVLYQEKDGRVFMLRNGIDGRDLGVYYAAAEFNGKEEMGKVIPTTGRYRPAFLPSDSRVINVERSYFGDDQLFGTVRLADGTEKLYIAEMNGTANGDYHTGIMRDHVRGNGFIHNGLIYFFEFNSSPTRFNVRTIPLNNPTGPVTDVTGWSGKGINGLQFDGQPDIRITNNVGSHNMDEQDCYASYPTEIIGAGVFQPWPRPEYWKDGDNLKIVFGHEIWIGSTNGEERMFVAREISVDLANRTYVLHPEHNESVRIYWEPGKVTMRGNGLFDRRRWDGGWNGNLQPTAGSANGFSYSFAMDNSRIAHSGMKAIAIDGSSLATRDFGLIGPLQPIPAIYGSPVGAYIYNLNPLDDNYLMVNCQIADDNGVIGLRQAKINMNGWEPTQDLTLFNGTKVKCPPLSSDREWYKARYTSNRTLVEIVNDKVYRSDYIFWRNKYSGFANMDLIEGGSGVNISIAESAFDAILNKAKALLDASAGNSYNGEDAFFIAVPQHANVKPFATLFRTRTDNRIDYIRLPLNFPSLTGVLTEPTYDEPFIYPNVHGGTDKKVNLSINYGLTQLTLADYDGFSIQTGCGLVWAAWVGNGGGLGPLLKIKNGVTTLLSTATSQAHTAGAYFMAFPKVGLVMTSGSPYESSSSYTVNGGYVIGKLEADIDKLTDKSGVVIWATVAVANGFIVYFTEEVPCTFGWKSGKTKISTLDLRTVDPAPENKTFFVYVRYVEATKTFENVVTLERLTTGPDVMFVGKITTDRLGIRDINVDKLVGIGGFVISRNRRGDAIPVALGYPTTEGNLSWK